jgi:GTP-binding protein
VEEAEAGDIIIISGLDEIGIGVTIADRENPVGLPLMAVDEPTLTMDFMVNTSPLAGTEGKFVTSRQIRERLYKQVMIDPALRVEDTERPDAFKVSGRGELHLTILIENMRREGFELAVSRPEVITKMVDGELQEPYETLAIDVPTEYQGTIMEKLGSRRGEVKNMTTDDKGRVRLDYVIPSRALIGFHTEFLTLTSGTGIMHHVFSHYGVVTKGGIGARQNGVLISNQQGVSLAFSLFNLQERGRMLISPQTDVYEGMVVGIHSRDNDLVVNVCKGKQLTNMRASGSDEAIILTPPILFSLEQALEFIEDDELVEITPESIRIRKKHLKEHERKRSSKSQD